MRFERRGGGARRGTLAAVEHLPPSDRIECSHTPQRRVRPQRVRVRGCGCGSERANKSAGEGASTSSQPGKKVYCVVVAAGAGSGRAADAHRYALVRIHAVTIDGGWWRWNAVRHWPRQPCALRSAPTWSLIQSAVRSPRRPWPSTPSSHLPAPAGLILVELLTALESRVQPNCNPTHIHASMCRAAAPCAYVSLTPHSGISCQKETCLLAYKNHY